MTWAEAGVAVVELTVDVSEVAALGVPAHTAVTVYAPNVPLTEPPVVCFAFPGGGYNRRYFALDLFDEPGGQAGYHAGRGWIFVACDHLGAGDSTVPENAALSYETVANANRATVQAVLDKLGAGALVPGLLPVTGAVILGIGQSMGGCLTIVLQGQHEVFDGIAVLGFSAVHTSIPARPGAFPAQWPWIPRGSDLSAPLVLNRRSMARAAKTVMGRDDLAGNIDNGEHPFAWCFHYDDVPRDLVAIDLEAKNPDGTLPYWRSETTPTCALQMVTPGTVTPEAAVIDVPVLVVAGERDVLPDPWQEPRAFSGSPDVTVFVCERMGHMHNFAGTRHKLWQRLHHWGTGVTCRGADDPV